MLEVVVLPCVPVTARVGRRRVGSPRGAQRAGVRRAARTVRAGDPGAERVRDEREPAHARAADADEVQRAPAPGLRAHRVSSLVPPFRRPARRAATGAMAEHRIDRVAREAFGFTELRPGQREAIESVLGGRDTLVVMSTGAGKSAIYQIAGLLIDGATVVVSPLIALQRDQVDDLAGAAQLNSTLPAAERERAL